MLSRSEAMVLVLEGIYCSSMRVLAGQTFWYERLNHETKVKVWTEAHPAAEEEAVLSGFDSARVLGDCGWRRGHLH